ncbi:hypothetical protein MKW94_029311 [Papaver nudicaule]|uniref:Uncharacterized protein n=1 Tax=Papaver nudicaule TaxID=74823 RepID=A0AA41VW53_PAPNU|nr:hypothetical protein [Papaver nudicaule]
MPLLHGKQALLVTGLVIFFAILLVDPIQARVLKMDNGGVADNAGRSLMSRPDTGHQNDSTVLSTASTGSDDKYLEEAGHDLVTMDYTPARKKSPIHN